MKAVNSLNVCMAYDSASFIPPHRVADFTRTDQSSLLRLHIERIVHVTSYFAGDGIFRSLATTGAVRFLKPKTETNLVRRVHEMTDAGVTSGIPGTLWDCITNLVQTKLDRCSSVMRAEIFWTCRVMRM